MLRLWQVNNTGLSDWQASLEDPHNGKKIGFADLESFFRISKTKRAEIEGKKKSRRMKNNKK